MRELIDPKSLMLGLHHVRASVHELKAGRQRFDDFATEQDNRFGIGIDNFAKGLEPLGRIHGITDDRIVDPVRHTDIADDDPPHMDADAYAHRVDPLCSPLLVVRRNGVLYGDGDAAGRFSRFLDPTWRAPKGHHRNSRPRRVFSAKSALRGILLQNSLI